MVEAGQIGHCQRVVYINALPSGSSRLFPQIWDQGKGIASKGSVRRVDSKRLKRKQLIKRF